MVNTIRINWSTTAHASKDFSNWHNSVSVLWVGGRLGQDLSVSLKFRHVSKVSILYIHIIDLGNEDLFKWLSIRHDTPKYLPRVWILFWTNHFQHCSHSKMSHRTERCEALFVKYKFHEVVGPGRSVVSNLLTSPYYLGGNWEIN